MSLVAFLSASDLSGVVVFYGLVSSMLWSCNWSCLVFCWLARRQIYIVLVKLHSPAFSVKCCVLEQPLGLTWTVTGVTAVHESWILSP